MQEARQAQGELKVAGLRGREVGRRKNNLRFAKKKTTTAIYLIRMPAIDPLRTEGEVLGVEHDIEA